MSDDEDMLWKQLEDCIKKALAEYLAPWTLGPSVEKKPVLTPEQVADGWLEWHGGECPVWGGSAPIVMLISGTIGVSVPASYHFWEKEHGIIAYRPDPYESLKKAHSEGKVIQILDFGDYYDIPNPDWTASVARYRVKPQPVMVPLGPEDVPPGSVFRYAYQDPAYLWFAITGVTRDGAENHHNYIYTWSELKAKLEISRDNGKTWQKCEKPQSKT